MIPTLTTDRLHLRGPDARDWPGFLDYFTSERSQFTGGPLEPRPAWVLFAAEIGHWAIHGFGMWSVTRKEDDTAIGLIGCWYPEGWPEKEIGWLLWPRAEGQGYAYEAATAVRAHVYNTLRWSTAVSYIAPGNIRSIALAERLGARLDPSATKPKPDTLVYRHPPLRRSRHD
ncbi:N-acetyltransferase [Rhodophyticola sp. CCM32]|uniref:GNAT family N-acetyltransferase n=1 Tax=Rhodophyticola sp. CCM32 TaxID=2916397 RepID=UPI00107F9713|nr:GNAT family N-acetyltransferase [Rhodophyticola sp. CCM32]QBY01543.1 N-acetyltransferase [Rhodophyticola sp. CCM32]